MGDPTYTDEQREAEQEKFQSLKQETVESLSIDPETGLTARIKHGLATLTYETSRGPNTPIPFKRSFIVLAKILHQADMRSPEALVKHVEDKFKKYKTSKAHPQSVEDAIVRYLKRLTEALDIPSPAVRFKRNTEFASL